MGAQTRQPEVPPRDRSAIVAAGRPGQGGPEHRSERAQTPVSEERSGQRSNGRPDATAGSPPTGPIGDRRGWAPRARRPRAPERAGSNARERGAERPTQPWAPRRDSRKSPHGTDRRSSRLGAQGKAAASTGASGLKRP